jgi:drug/metabolite transporter (DMT)-like permease
VAVLMSRSLNLSGAPVDRRGALALIVASASWSLGSVLTRKLTLPSSKGHELGSANAGRRIFSGDHVSGALGEFRGFHPSAVSREAWFALLYLIVAGSIIGFTAYVWLIHHESPTKVATYAYVNPCVAVFVGYFLGGESLGLRTILGTLFVLTSVVVITSTKAPRPPPASRGRSRKSRGIVMKSSFGSAGVPPARSKTQQAAGEGCEPACVRMDRGPLSGIYFFVFLSGKGTNL